MSRVRRRTCMCMSVCDLLMLVCFFFVNMKCVSFVLYLSLYIYMWII